MPSQKRALAKWANKTADKPVADTGTVLKIQQEAKAHGATLANGGKGGLDPALALKVFRQGGWKCDVDGCKTPKTNLDLDHISGHAAEIKQDPDARTNPKLLKGVALGHVDKPEALHVICKRHHDEAHNRDRAIVDGKKPPAMGA